MIASDSMKLSVSNTYEKWNDSDPAAITDLINSLSRENCNEIFGIIASELSELSAIKNFNDQAVSTIKFHGQFIADLCKTDQYRSEIGSSNILSFIAKLHVILNKNYSSFTLNAIIQLTRALGNSCIENDANIEICLNCDGLLQSCLLLLTRQETFVYGCGILMNASVENEQVQSALASLNALDVIWNSLQNGVVLDSTTKANACNIMANIVECDAGAGKLCTVDCEKGSLLQLLVEHLHKSPQGELAESLKTVLESACERPIFQTALVSQGTVFAAILDLIELNIDPLSHALSRVVAAISLHDENMEVLLDSGSVANRFTLWLSAGNGTKQFCEIRMNAALCIGNLARSDASCERLVFTYAVVPKLIALWESDLSSINAGISAKSDFKGYVQSLFAVIGAFRNLSCAPKCQEFLGESGLIQLVAQVLQTPGIKPLYQGCAVIAKNLCSANQLQNAIRATIPTVSATENTCFECLMQLVNSAIGDNDLGLRTEAARAVVNIIKLAYTSESTIRHAFLSKLLEQNALLAVLQLLTGKVLKYLERPAGNEEPWSHHHVHFERIMAEGQVFPTLQKDALVAALLLCEMDERVSGALCAWAPVYISVLYGIIAGTEKTFGDLFAVEEHRQLESRLLTPSEDAVLTSSSPVELPYQVKALAVVLLQKLLSSSKDFKSSLKQSLGLVVQEALSKDAESVGSSVSVPETELVDSLNIDKATNVSFYAQLLQLKAMME